MDITEVSILHHAGIVLLLLWLLSAFHYCHPVSYLIAFCYLFMVHERYVFRLRKKLQFEEKKQSYQKRVLSDSESVRWLNHAVEKIWPICMEQIASQKILLPIVPWFLEKYKPWTAKKAVVQHLYLGRNPPMFTEVRVLRNSNDDDHLVLELGMNFLTADDMSAILAVKLRKRLGFGMWAKLHITGMHIEGKVLIGVKFLRDWPFLGRLRLCFVEPPYFQMTVKPIFTHGLDVTEFPGIAGWLDKLLSIAFEQTLVEPNMLVVDVEKFTSPEADPWFSVDEKEPVAYAKVEIIEATDMKPSDLNGLADPYVKGNMGAYRFRTKTQRKTLAPKWQEEFKIPIISWESPNVLAIEVLDKDHFVDDTLGDYSINISDLRDGQRHDMWLPLRNIKTGRLHLAVTILEDNGKGVDNLCEQEFADVEDKRDSFANDGSNKGSFSSVSSEKSPKVADNFEPIDIEGQNQRGIWVHQPGSEVPHTWEPRKGKNRRLDTEILNASNESQNPSASGSLKKESSSTDENSEDKHRLRSIRRGIRKISSVFHRSHRKEDQSSNIGESVPSPHANIRAINQKEIGVKLVVDENFPVFDSCKVQNEGACAAEGDGQDSPSKSNVKGAAKSFLKHAEKSARSIKHVLSRKGSSKFRGVSIPKREMLSDSESSDETSTPPSVHSLGTEEIPAVPKATSNCTDGVVSRNPIDNVLLTGTCDPLVDVVHSRRTRSTEYVQNCSSPVHQVPCNTDLVEPVKTKLNDDDKEAGKTDSTNKELMHTEKDHEQVHRGERVDSQS